MKPFYRYVIFTLIILLISLQQIPPIFAAAIDKAPEISADSAILVDAGRGQILFGKASSKKIKVSTASKIMTAILTIEKSQLNAKVTVSKDAANVKGSLLNLEVGAKYNIQDLLYAIVLTTANDAAAVLAESVSGDVNKFVELMNLKARELKMTDTVFKNPTGLNDDDQYTTAYDLSILVRYAVSNPTFDKLFSIKATPWNNDLNSRILVNSNKLFWSYDGIDGGKTGSNEENRLSVVTTATRYGMKLVSVVLDSNSEKAYEDSVKVLDYGFKNYRKDILVRSGQVLKSIDIGENKINLISKEDVQYVHPLGNDYINTLAFSIEENIKLPVTKDKALGIAEYTLKDNTKIPVSLFPSTELRPPEGIISSILKKLTAQKQIFAVIILLVIIEIILIIKNFTRYLRKKYSNKSEK